MTKKMALDIFKNIYDENVEPEDKLAAIQEVLELESNRVATKEKVLDALRWVMEEYI